MRKTTSNQTIQYCEDDFWSPEMSEEQFGNADIDFSKVSQVIERKYLTREEAQIIKNYYRKQT